MELEINMWITYHYMMFIILGIVGMATLLFVWHTRDRRRIGLPLGTLGWPFLGETLEFISCGYSSRPESFMDKRRILYGKVFKSHILGRPTIISTDPEVSKVVLQNDGRVFVPSYPKSVSELMGKSSILVLSGSLHKRVHGLIGGFLKSPQLKEQMTIDIENYVQISMSKWKDDQTIYIQDETKEIAFQVLVKALISLGPGEEMEYLQQEFRKFISGLISVPIKIPGTRLYRSLQAKANMAKRVRRIIEERKKDVMICNLRTRPKDVLDVLLQETDDVDLISDNIIDLMIPGEDSVPMLMTLAVKHLTDCPLALHKLQEENMKLQSSKEQTKERPTWGDYMSLSFTQNVITETLRMGNIIIGVLRRALQDIEIKGHFIPKGWHVLTYFRSIHLDKDFYENPYQFNPWRWQDKDANGSSFTPFGGGQRLCPGIDIARLEASIFLHHLVTRYSWEAEDDSIVNFPTIQMEKRMPLKVKNVNPVLFSL